MTEELKLISTVGLSVKFIAERLSSDWSINQCLGDSKFEGDGESCDTVNGAQDTALLSTGNKYEGPMIRRGLSWGGGLCGK